MRVIAASVRAEVATKVTPVPNGETKASMYKRIESQVKPRRIAKSAKGEEKLIPCQPTLAKVVGSTAPIKATCRAM